MSANQWPCKNYPILQAKYVSFNLLYFHKTKNSLLIKLFFFSELELQKARLETKKESIVKGRSQKKKELALTKRSLSELDGFSTKLEKLKR